MIFVIKGNDDIVLLLEELVLDPFLDEGFNFAILQDSGKLHSSLIGFAKTRKSSLKKRSESSYIPAALRTLRFLFFFCTDSCIDMK